MADLFVDFYYVGVVVLVAMRVTVKIYKHECQRPHCGHQWNSLKTRPVVCPRCKSYSWDEKPKGKGK